MTRPLPHIIGTPLFMQEDDVGLVEPPSGSFDSFICIFYACGLLASEINLLRTERTALKTKILLLSCLLSAMAFVQALCSP